MDFPEQGLLSSNLLSELELKGPKTSKWLKAVAAEKNVNSIWDVKVSADEIKLKFGVK